MSLSILETGPLVTIQDRGRPGFAHLGVPRSGALDPASADLANRLVGNLVDAAVLEVLLGGVSFQLASSVWMAVTGAAVPVSINGRSGPMNQPVRLRGGDIVRLGQPTTGLRTYLAFSGGCHVSRVLGSSSTDTLSGLGPPPVVAGAEVRLGEVRGQPVGIDVPPRRVRTPIRVQPGPRADWVHDVGILYSGRYVVHADSDRVGLRLAGPPLVRREGELPSEPVVLGAIEILPDGQPVVFLADHPTTGGYPVVGVIRRDDLWQCAQTRPGESVQFVADV